MTSCQADVGADAICLKARKGYEIGPASKLQIGDVSAAEGSCTLPNKALLTQI